MTSELTATKASAPVLTPPQGEQPGALYLPLDLFFDMVRTDSLDEEDIVALQRSCTHFYTLLNDDTRLWNLLFQRAFGSRDKPQHLSYQEAFARLCTNLAQGIFTTARLQKDSSNIALAGDCLISTDFIQVSGTQKEEPVFRFSDLKTKKPLRVLHRDVVFRVSPVVINSKLLIGCDFDDKLKIIDLDSGKCLRTIEGQLSRITCYAYADGKLFSGDNTGTIMVWNVETGQGSPIHEGHAKKVTAITASRKKLFSASQDGIIISWDLETLQGPLLKEGRSVFSAQRTYTLPEIGYVDTLVLTDDKLIVGSRNGLQILEAKTGKCLHKLLPTGNFVRSLVVAGKMMISSSQYSSLAVYHLKTGKVLGNLSDDEFDDQIFSDGKLIGANNRGIEVFDFMTDNTAVFEELARKFKSVKEVAFVENIVQRFSRMPKEARNEIYEKFSQILGPGYSGNAEDAFHDRNGQSSTPVQKAQAIEDYLAEKAQQ